MAKEEVSAKINSKFKIKKSGDGISLIETVEGKDKDGNPKDQEDISYYGCVYQALQGIIKKTADRAKSFTHLRMAVKSAMKDILDAEEKIKERFCIEVRKE